MTLKRKLKKKEVKKAFSLLHEKQDLYEVFNILINRITLYQNKKLQIEYTFGV